MTSSPCMTVPSRGAAGTGAAPASILPSAAAAPSVSAVAGTAPRAGRATLGFHAAVLGTYFAAAVAPTPLYVLYREAFALSAGLLTVVFTVYAFTLLGALLFMGSLSDRFGRRPVIFAALLLQATAMLIFLRADGLAALLVGRTIQGFATGIAVSSLGAALVDCDRRLGAQVNGLAPLLGMALGGFGSSVLVTYAPEPLHLVYGVILVLCLAEAALTFVFPETNAERVATPVSLVPRIRIPEAARTAMLRITPLNVGHWALCGFAMSLMPGVVARATGIHSPLLGGAIVASVFLPAACSSHVLRGVAPHAIVRFAAPLSMLGIALVVTGVHLGAPALVVGGLMVLGLGLGGNFLAIMRTLVPLASAHERSEMMAAYFLQCYLAMSIPVLVAGFAARSVGLAATVDGLGAICVLLIAAGGVAVVGGAQQASLAGERA
ncbi:MFS transporter [Acuticoccus sediminis]|uniref:MFS transporter n=1 Tax=Acuticoccus sediminis TaxID=2184697 RepID=UPI001CFDBD08|nr:MFS transporter [Acuticoccus sediminis]